jgi:predicted nucleic acid-binding protein
LKQPNLARKLLEIYIGYRFEEEPAANLLGTALDIMKAVGATFYDAAYHSVALKHRGTYLTADNKYARKAMAVGHVVALKNWAGTSE